MYEKLKFSDGKFSASENKISWSYFISKNIACAVSPRRYASAGLSAPTLVLNIKLNSPWTAYSPPHSHLYLSASFLSIFVAFLHFLHITATSLKLARWPEAFQVLGCEITLASIPTMFSF